MTPGLRSGAVIVAIGKSVRRGDIVIARQAGREVVKRVYAIESGRYVLRGDNAEESVDSREFGPVEKEAILGVVMLMLPSAVSPPSARTPYAQLVGWAAAGVMILSALIHLFRIDTFLPLLDKVLPGDYVFAAGTGALIVILEVFAVPFLLRMKLSPLMHLVSGIAAVLAPLVWLLVTIWALGHSPSTAQFGEFMATKSSVPLMMLNVGWLGFNLWALWLLGLDRIRSGRAPGR